MAPMPKRLIDVIGPITPEQARRIVVLLGLHRAPEEINMDAPDPLLTPEQVSAWVQLNTQTLANMRWRGVGPAYIKLGADSRSPVRYRRSAVEQWLNAGTVNHAGA